MYCTRCGIQLDESARYCSQCGSATPNAMKPVTGLQPKPLIRLRYDKKIAGVCAGFAQYCEVDVTLVRLIWLVLLFGVPPVGLIGYIIAWIVMPIEPPRLIAGTPEPIHV
jgi:phage shock protein C